MDNIDTTNNKVAAVILGAGRGKRMQSKKQKIVFSLLGKPIISYILKTLENYKVDKIVIVVGYKAEEVKQTLGNNYDYVMQKKRLGNAHALLQARKVLENKFSKVFVFHGDDSFLYSRNLLKEMYKKQKESGATITLLTLKENNKIPLYFWNALISNGDRVMKIFNGYQENIKSQRALAGSYLFDSDWLWKTLPKLPINKSINEYILPDLVQIAIDENKIVNEVIIEYGRDWCGINTPLELKEAESIIRKENNGKFR